MAHEISTSEIAGSSRLNSRLDDIGWGLLFMLTGLVWIAPFPEGTWLFGVAAILVGLNVVRYLMHIRIDGFSLVLGLVALIVALSPVWPSDLPLLAICLLVIGALLIVKPLLTRTA